jgi:arylsulfate sulfotransferase
MRSRLFRTSAMPQLYSRFLMIFVVCLWLCACKDTNLAPPAPAPLFLSEPSIVLDPNLNTPLAAQLQVATNLPTQVVLDISNDTKSWTIEFAAYQTEHTLPVLGFYPDKTHEIAVHVISQDGQRRTFDKPLQLTTDPLPDGFPTIVVNRSEPDKMEPGYTLFDIIPEGNNAEFGAMIVIVDESGTVVWYQIGSRYTDVRQTANGNLIYLQGSEYIEMDMLGNSVREWKAMGSSKNEISEIPVATPSMHHEVFPMENGNFLTLSIEARSFSNYPTKAWKPDSPRETVMVAGDLVVEFAPDGSTVNEWSLLDLLDPYRIGYDSLGKYWDSFFGTKTRDWSHANSVIHDPRDDSVIVSIRHQDAVVKFSRKTGKLIWILGSHDNWDTRKFGKYLLKPVNDQQYFFPFHQHSPMILPSGNLMLYDNGNYRANPYKKTLHYSKNFSRAVEYAIDEKNMTIELVWEHGQFTEERVFSGALGDANYLPKTGNILIAHGNIFEKKPGNKLSAQIIEVTHTTPAVEVFNLVIFDETPDPSNGWRVYRSERISSLHPG